ncbi:hypothetical protein MKX03_009578 [Papaver bracteatum]|nr:hypothetical protein MKX03_009578 [Papaver bracteatum]
MKSPKVEGEFSSPNQAAATVSIGKSNIKTPKSEMLDYSSSSDTKIGIKTLKSEMFDSTLLSDTKPIIKIPKTEVFELPEKSPILLISSDSEGEIKTPKSEMLSVGRKDTLTPLKRRFYATSYHPVTEEHSTSDDDEENTSTGDDEESSSTDEDEDEHDSTDNIEENGSTDEEDEDEEHDSSDEDEDEEHGSADEDEEHGTSPAENNLDEEEWVTVFGFTYKDTNLVLREFKKCGVILDNVRQGNWMHILYQNQREAQKALSKSGKKISEVLIVGVNPVDPNKKQALNDRKPSLCGDRVRKALHESIRLLHRSEGKFFVLAATGNVYTVTLSTTPVCRCNCPDGVVPCKHILFVFLRVLGISQNDCRLCRKRLKPCQLADLLKLPSSARTLADAYTRDKFRHLYTTAKVKVGLPPSIGNGLLCAICHAKWHLLGDHEMVKCGSCGDIGHRTCLVNYRRSHGKVVRKCKSCRTNWVAAVQNWYTLDGLRRASTLY